MASSVYIRALRKAAEIAGGRRALAERLGVKLPELETWLAGKKAVPREPFLRAVELIVDELSPEGDPSDPGEPPPRVSSAWSPRDRE
jgi:DNA-binding transcriptional regulator YdaS (Cro superfamily)